MADELMHVIRFETTLAAEEPLAEFAAAFELNFASVKKPESEILLAQFFAESAEEAEQLRARLAAELPAWLGDAAPAPAALESATLKREDWAESWKKFFHVQRITDRLVVKPSWEAFTPAPGDVVLELDPGMSFGTGYHGTTRACLEFLDTISRRVPGASMLDVGCGSGILALAAWKLGFRPVAAYDYDPQAVLVARENLERNGITEIVPFQADLTEWEPEHPSRVVAANILAPVLLQHAERITACLDRSQGPAFLILSGILHTQYDQVRDRFTALGLAEGASRRIDDWTSGWFTA